MRELRRELRRELTIGGFVPFSTGDFPGELAAVVFCQGCPWRCRYCHNPHLQPRRCAEPLRWSDLLPKLERRKGFIDAVVFSGGEPTAQASALLAAVKATRTLGFRIGLHTAGIHPRSLQAVLAHLDWVGFDVKATRSAYPALTGVPSAARRVEQSLRLLLDSGVPHEVRTTVHRDLISELQLLELARELSRLGVKRYVLQPFRSQGCADAALNHSGAQSAPGAEVLAQIEALFESFELRKA